MEYTLNTFEDKINSMFPFNHIKILSFNGASKPITYQCLDCGKIYHKTRANHLYENKTLCSKCYTARNSKMREWILKFFENSDQFILLNKWQATSVNLEVLCLNCRRIFKKQPANIYLKDEKTVCPYCGDNGGKVDIQEFYRRLSPKDKKDYKILQYKTFTKPAVFKHKCGFEFTRTPYNFLKSCGCPKCNHKMSIGEKSIERFLLINKINYEYEKKFKDLGKLSYDFFLPDYNILIEYQGQQHYEPINYFGDEKKFKIQQEHDRIKQNYASQHNYQLICIPYTDLNNIENYLTPILKVQRLSREGVESSDSK